MEIFKDIKGYEGMYKVTSWGNILSLKTNKLMKFETTKKGYQRVTLVKNGKRKHFKVHRLVAMAFLDNKDNLPQVNHMDGDKKNNHITNLEFVTNIDNQLHRRWLYEQI